MVKIIVYRNRKDVRKLLKKLFKKGYIKKNPETREFEITPKGIKECKKKGFQENFLRKY